MTILHNAIQSADCHEPKHITNSVPGDAGKVITPSGVSAGTSVLRKLTVSEIDGLTAALAGKQASIPPEPDIPNLTDSTTGTPGATLTALPDPTDAPANADALRDDLVANVLPVLRNYIASLNAEINKLKAALRATGIIETP